jgi:predicted kinase
MAKVYVMVGVPGSGKSTWIKNQVWALGMPVISTDDFVEAYAREQGKTYSEVFDEYMPTAVNLMAEQVVFYRDNGVDMIWDQTSTTVKSRERKFRMLPDYEHIAVVFATPEWKELKQRLDSRPGKHVPKEIVEGMIHNFEEPTLEEGYSEIWRAV